MSLDAIYPRDIIFLDLRSVPPLTNWNRGTCRFVPQFLTLYMDDASQSE